MRCGLSREHRDRFVADTSLPPGLAEKWEAVLAGWDDQATHAVFLETCAQAEALELAAARYRALQADPARAERCHASLDRIVTLAEAALKRTASSGAERIVRHRRIIFAVAALVMLVFLAVVAWAVMAR